MESYASQQSTNFSSTGESVDVDPDDVISILLASDIHLGHKENDKERGQDSYDAFEEVLQIAVSRNVDFILLGGDLFDKANPSSYALNKCLMLLRTYCMGGEKPIHIEFLSNQNDNFKGSINKRVNYEDENMNISIPVFSIHGNHDDPSGFGNLSALDLLSTSGLVNYFGKLTNLQNLEIYPIMLKKGETKLAIYGMSYIQDNRLTRLFDDKKVKMAMPEGSETDWFNMFVLHQNRANRGVKNYLPEESLPDFLDFIVWGHEHDCRIEPEQHPHKRFYVSQPGSTVATSLAEGEAGVKKCAVLEIYRKNFKIEAIPLRTVRPFVFDTLCIGNLLSEEEQEIGNASELVKELASKKIEKMLKEANKLRTGHEKQPKLPLLRLRVEVTNVTQMFQAIRFGQSYGGKVANPDDIITFKRQIRRDKDDVKIDKDALEEAYLSETVSKANKVEDVVKRYFDEMEDEEQKMQFLSLDCMAEITRHIVNGASKTTDILEFYMKEGKKFLEGCSEEEVDAKLAEFRAQEDTTFKNLLTTLDQVKKRTPMEVDDFIENGSDENDASPAPTKPKRGGKQAATTSTRGKGRGRGAKASTSKAAPSLNVSRTSRARKAQPANDIYEVSDSD